VTSEGLIGKDAEGSDYGIILRSYSSIRLDGLMKTMKNLSQDRRYLGRDLNPIPPEYEKGDLTTRLRLFFWVVKLCWFAVSGQQRFGATYYLHIQS
jgi:hypothetical protein